MIFSNSLIMRMPSLACLLGNMNVSSLVLLYLMFGFMKHILHAYTCSNVVGMWRVPDGPDGAAPSSPAAPDSQTLGSYAASVCAVSPRPSVTRPSAARPEVLRIWWLYPAAVRCTGSPPAPGFAVVHTHTHTHTHFNNLFKST